MSETGQRKASRTRVAGALAGTVAFLTLALTAAMPAASPAAQEATTPPAPEDESAPSPADEIVRNKPTMATLRLRMGVKGQISLYPPTVATPAGVRPVLFFSSDWGWRPLQQDTASWLANHGRYVVGIDSPDYFNKPLDPLDWARDLKTLRAFVNEKAGQPPESPVLLMGSTWGGELVPYMLNRGGIQGFAGALLVAPDEEGAIVFRVSLQMKKYPVPTPPEERFAVPDELRRLPPFPLVFLEGELDTDSRARALSNIPRGPVKFVSIPGGDKKFTDVRNIYMDMVSQALAWLEAPHPGAGAPAPR
jgi:virulence protein VirJ